MKTKLKDKMVSVQVITCLLVYSLDKLTTLEAQVDDVIEIPSWMVGGLVAAERVKTDIDEELLTTADEEEEEEVDEEELDITTPLTAAEMRDLNDVDFAEYETTADLIKWVEDQKLLEDLVIHPACKRDTSIGKIFDAIDELKED